MAITAVLYDHTAKLFANGEVSLADLKFMLLSDLAVFAATDTGIDAVAGASPDRANEVHNGGWTEGGEVLASAAVTVATTNDAKLDAADITKNATGEAIGPADFGVIYDSNSGNVLVFVDFDGPQTAGESTDFKVVWHANGIVTWSYAGP